MVKLAMAATVLGLLAVSACAQYEPYPAYGYKRPVGTLAGAGLGALAGSKIGAGSGNVAATAVGALIGAVVGGGVGESLDRADAVYYQHAISQQAPWPYVRQRSYYYYYDTAPMVPYVPAPVYGSWQTQNCQPLVGQGPPGLACQAPNGGWFISR